MKIGCSLHILADGTLSQQAAFLAEIGFDGMEVAGTPEEISEQLPELRAILAAGTIEISAVCGLHHSWLIDPDADRRREALEDIGRMLEMAGELGCGVSVIPILGYTHAYPGGRTTGRTPDEDRTLLVETLCELARHAERTGAALWLEVINRYESPVANTLAEGMEIIRAVNSPACRLHADFFHMNIEEADLAAALRQCGELLAYVHAGDSRRTYPGFGHLDYLALVRALVEGGYRGYLSVDAGDARVDPARVLLHVAHYLRGVIGLAEERVRCG